MFATGIFAHSLLLPFIGILVQVFVLNFCAKPLSELSAHPESRISVVYSAAAVGSSMDSHAVYFFGDHQAACSTEDSVATFINKVRVEYPRLNEVYVGLLAVSMPSLRAPPLN